MFERFLLCIYVLLGSGIGNVDPNRRGEENIAYRGIPSPNEVASQQTGWKESQESAAENQEQGNTDQYVSVCCHTVVAVQYLVGIQT